MSEPHIDVTKIKWFPGYADVPLGGLCDHKCEHRSQSVIAWGPNKQHYELILCEDCGCRAWQDMRYEQERQSPTGEAGFWYDQMEWRIPQGVA